MYEAFGESSFVGGSPIAYAAGVRVYISGRVEDVYVDRRKAYCPEFVLWIHNKI